MGLKQVSIKVRLFSEIQDCTYVWLWLPYMKYVWTLMWVAKMYGLFWNKVDPCSLEHMNKWESGRRRILRRLHITLLTPVGGINTLLQQIVWSVCVREIRRRLRLENLTAQFWNESSYSSVMRSSAVSIKRYLRDSNRIDISGCKGVEFELYLLRQVFIKEIAVASPLSTR